MKPILKVIIKILAQLITLSVIFYMGRTSVTNQIYSISLHDKVSIESAFNSIVSDDDHLLKVIFPNNFVYALAIISILFLVYAIFYNLRNKNSEDDYNYTDKTN